MSFTVRPCAAEDYAALLEIATAAAPFDPDGIREWVAERRQLGGGITRHYVVELNDELIGFGALEQQGVNTDHLRVYVVFEPPYLHSAGDLLYDVLLAEARSLGARTLWVREYLNDADLLKFFHTHGFVEKSLVWDMRLSLPTFDPGAFEDALRQFHERGLRIRDLVQERDNPQHARLLHDLFGALDEDPGSLQSFLVSFPSVIEWVEQQGIPPEATFLAVEDGDDEGKRYVGICALHFDRANGLLTQYWTGVHRQYRAQGIALALRVHSLDYARARGYGEIIAYANNADEGMLALNERLGYRKVYGYVMLHKKLIDA